MNGWHSLVIEPLTSVDDIDAVLAIEEASFTNPWTRAMYLAELEHKDVARIVLAKDHARVIGFCSFWLVQNEIHINNLAVLPEHRRRGAASAILRRVLADCARAGAQRAMLEMRRSNDAARQLYERLGFRVAGLRRGYYSHPTEDAVVLWRENLSPQLETS